MITIAICDDKLTELNKAKDMCRGFASQYSDHKIRIISFSSPVDLMNYICKREPLDILLLDIYMPEMSGMELAHNLRSSHSDCQIIFITSSPAHAVEAFSLHATHYLVKPFTQTQLEDALSKAMAAISKKKESILLLKNSEGLHKINLDHFLYAETEKHNQHIFMTQNQCLQIRITSTELYGMLSHDRRFFKCGSTYIINLDLVEEVTPRNILFDGGAQLPMQRRQYKELLHRYTGYMLEES